MECAICCEDFTHINSSTLSCNHAFHSACIAKWASINPSCPNCRKNLAPVEVYYASIDMSASIRYQRPPPIDTSYTIRLASPPRIRRYAYPTWNDIPDPYNKYINTLYQDGDTSRYDMYLRVKAAASKIQAIGRGYICRSMYAWAFA